MMKLPTGELEFETNTGESFKLDLVEAALLLEYFQTKHGIKPDAATDPEVAQAFMDDWRPELVKLAGQPLNQTDASFIATVVTMKYIQFDQQLKALSDGGNPDSSVC